jgi:hypothetical protein
MNLSPHFTLDELTHTDHREIDNSPNQAEIDNLQRLANFLEEVKTAHRPSDTLILDRQGEVLHRLRTDKQIRRHQFSTTIQRATNARFSQITARDSFIRQMQRNALLQLSY